MPEQIRYIYIIRIAFEALMLNRTRSALTALGIIFGVAAVIAMMAVGNGARKEILDQMKLVGVNNIIIVPKTEESKQEQSKEEQGKKLNKGFSSGLTLLDTEAIQEIIPEVEAVSAEVTYETLGIYEQNSKNIQLSGVTPAFFNTFNLQLEKGEFFSKKHFEEAAPVCIIGSEVRTRLFPDKDPMGELIKCGGIWMEVVGILTYTPINEASTGTLGISNYNKHVYAPINTVLSRFKDRSLITSNLFSGGSFYGGDFIIVSDNAEKVGGATHQVDKIVVRMKSSDKLESGAEVIKRMLLRRHNRIEDFEVKIPEMLLKQEQRTKDIFNIVLGAIASISLLVGGIGIMNIMLASVLERIKEIGIRMAIGARRKDIVLQFLSEALLLSISGGIIGILLGYILSKAITHFAGILTIISPISIVVSFGVSAAVGIIFGLMPARKAAAQDPVTSLRYE